MALSVRGVLCKNDDKNRQGWARMAGVEDEEGSPRRRESPRWLGNGQTYWEKAPGLFFSHWKAAVELAGVQYFAGGNKDCLSAATSWRCLPPDLSRIESTLSFAEPADGIFLAALCSFYDYQRSRPLLRRLRAEGLADIIRPLDPARRQLLARLLLTYTGW